MEIIEIKDVVVVAFKDASISNAETVRSAGAKINEFIEENHPEKIVFDFEPVKFFSSQVLGVLLDVRAKLKTCKGRAVISAIDPQLHKVFKITHLDKIFTFFPDRNSAVETISRFPGPGTQKG